MTNTAFAEELTSYINGRPSKRGERLLLLFVPRLFFRKRAAAVIRAFRAVSGGGTGERDAPRLLRIPPYGGKNAFVLRLRDEISARGADDILFCAVHGSLGSEEDVGYSDFDAAAVLRDQAFSDPRRLARAAFSLFKLQDLMFSHDPLQHHGWFALAELEAKAYPQSFLPVEALERAGALWPPEGAECSVWPRHVPAEARRAWEKLYFSLMAGLEREPPPARLYGLKSLLSRFMLLPSLYLQARDGTFLFKKYGFEAARRDFSPETWSVMEDVSKIRAEWRQEMSSWRRFLFSRSAAWSRPLASRLSPGIPHRLKERMEAGLYRRMGELARAMHARLGGARS